MLSYLLVALLAIVLTLVLRRVLRVNVLLVFVATVTTAMILQVVAYVGLGYLDPFFLIAFLTSSLLAGLVSALTVIVLGRVRLRKDTYTRQP